MLFTNRNKSKGVISFLHQETRILIADIYPGNTGRLISDSAMEGYRKIIHIDMDAFYASVEVRENPALKGKPVVVGGSPQGRGVVAAASYEARKYGIHSAMPASRAIRLCPNAIFLKPQFELYREVSEQIREIFFEYTDLVEPLSLDEAYLDVTENHVGVPSATIIASQIREKIKIETGLTASAGVAPNKFLAKVASDINKPDGLKVIPPDEADAFLEHLPIKKFHGIGSATEKKMVALGITNGAELKKRSELELVQSFGKVGRHYYRIVRGQDNRAVKPHRIRKSIGKEKTFRDDVVDFSWLSDFLQELVEKVSGRAKQLGAMGRTVTLKIRYDDFETLTRSYSSQNATNEAGYILETGRKLLEETEAGARPVRLLGITLGNLEGLDEKEGRQLELEFMKEVKPGRNPAD